MHELMQRHRHRNLGAVLAQLSAEGLEGMAAHAEHFRLPTILLQQMVDGAFIPDVFARDVEWTQHLRAGWLDELHDTERL